MKPQSPVASRGFSVFGRLLVTLFLVTSNAACGRAGTSGGAGTKTLEAVQPPPELAQLDQAVQDQFHQLQDHLVELRGRTGGDEAARGSAWGALGEWYYVYRYSTSARACFHNAEALAPEDPRWPYYLGILSEDDGDLDQAEAGYRRAAELAPKVPAPRVRLGDLALGRQDLERAEQLYAGVLAEEPDNPGALLGSAQLALARDEPEAALEPLQKLARSQPEALQVNYTLSLAWRRLGDDRRADEALGRIPAEVLDQIPLDRDDPWERELQRADIGARTLTRRGVRAFRRGDKERAAVLLGRALAANPNGAETRFNYALALRGLGRWRDARDELNEALARADEGSELAAKAHLEMGRLLLDTGRPRAAAPHLQAALRIDPDSAPAHLVYGRLEQRRGNLEAALGHYTAVRNLEGEIPGVRFWHAALLLALDRRREAFDALTEDISLADDPSGPKLLLARLLSTTDDPSLRDVSRARTLLGEVAKAKGPDMLFAETAAMVAAAEGDFDAAIEWESAAVDRGETLSAQGPVHIARRRLVLYRERTPCRTPWERQERRVTLAVDAPAAAP